MRWGGKSGQERGASATDSRTASSAAKPQPSPEQTRLNALALLVDKLSQEVDGLDAARSGRDMPIDIPDMQIDSPSSPRSPRPAATPVAPSATLEARMAALGRQLDERQNERQQDRLGGIETRLSALAEQLSGANSPRPAAAAPAVAMPTTAAAPAGSSAVLQAASLKSAIAEIAERQKRLDDEARAIPPQPAGIDFEETIAGLRLDISAIGRRLGDEIRRLQNRPGDVDPAMIAELRGDIAELRRGIDLAARETTLASIESGYGHIIERLDEIVRRTPGSDRVDAIAEEIIRLAAAIDRSQASPALGAELEDIRNALASMQATGGSAEMEREIAALRQAVEGLARRPAASVDTSPIEHALGAIRQDIEDFSRLMQEEPESLTRLEREVAAIRSTVDAFAGRSNAFDSTALSRLEDRLDALVGRFDALAELPTLRAPISATALDSIGNEIRDFRQEFAAQPPLSLDAIEAQMKAMMRRFDEIPSAPSTLAPLHAIREIQDEIGDLRREIQAQEPVRLDAIEQQMSLLVARIDEAMRADDGDALARLEAQIATLTEELAASRSGPDPIARIEADLDRIQSLIGGAQEDSRTAARDAARAAISEYAGALPPAQDDGLVQALRGDLSALQEAASRSDRQTQQTLESVHETLAKVVGRIADLELGTEAPKPAPRRARPAAEADAPEDHRPLAPGSGKPSLSSLRETVAEVSQPLTGDRKADFIAAARRAAQAAQAEQARVTIDPPTAETAEEPRNSTFAKLGQALRSRRRPLVLAMAAVVLALAAAQFAPKAPMAVNWAMETFTPGPKAVTPVAMKMEPPATNKSAARFDPVTTGSVAPAAALVPPKDSGSSSLAFAPADDAATHFDAAPAQPATASFAPVKADTATQGLGLQAAADKGDPAAEFELGRRLAEGDGVARDMAQAARWYQKAAEAGQPVAAYRIGSLYERGEGVKRDTAAAQSWYERASDAGNAQATHNLAVLLSEGANGQPDYARAFALFERAAAMGIADSQYNLGVLYARGLGVSTDLVQSYKWFALAAAQGDNDAGKRRDEVARALKPEALIAARAAVKGFRLDAVNAAANELPIVPPQWRQADVAGDVTTFKKASQKG